MNYPFRNAALCYVTGGDVHAVAEHDFEHLRKLPLPGAELR